LQCDANLTLNVFNLKTNIIKSKERTVVSINRSTLSKYKSKATIAIVVTAAIVVPTVADDNEIKVTWKDTLRLESADGNNKLKFGGRIHWQNAFFSDD
jgi:hypothetical protein